MFLHIYVGLITILVILSLLFDIVFFTDSAAFSSEDPNQSSLFLLWLEHFQSKEYKLKESLFRETFQKSIWKLKNTCNLALLLSLKQDIYVQTHFWFKIKDRMGRSFSDVLKYRMPFLVQLITNAEIIDWNLDRNHSCLLFLTMFLCS